MSVNFDAQHEFGGMKLYVNPDTVRPKMQLSDDCPVTPDFRAEMNAWMLEFFGSVVENSVPDGVALASSRYGAFHVNPRTFAALKGASL